MAVTALRSSDAAARWLREWVTGALCTDSRRVRPGDGFIAWPGYATDARRFVASALKAGATTCLVEAEGIEAYGFDDARVASLPGLKAAAGVIADAYFDRPSAGLDVLAVTGTNGKTSSSWWIAQALTVLGQRCGVVGTLGVGVPPVRSDDGDHTGDVRATGLTTPDPVLLHAAIRGFADRGFKACAMEASSIGIEEHRLAGVRVGVAVFTNFTQDHLDYHGTMQAYWAAKRKLFAWPGLRGAAINIDDPAGASLAQELKSSAPSCRIIDCTALPGREAALAARDVRYVDGGLAFDIVERSADAVAPVQTSLIGDYNVSNVLGVVAALRLQGVSLQDAARACARLTPVPGRMQREGGEGLALAVVDYAHTPDALDKALAALRPLAEQRGGRLIVVFGCGGDRDPSKRALMGAIAARRADIVVVTSDNPRSESPESIIESIAAGVPSGTVLRCVVDRRQALRETLAGANAQDVVLVAGKGHEDYQEIRGVRHPFSDTEEVRAALAAQRASRRSAA